MNFHGDGGGEVYCSSFALSGKSLDNLPNEFRCTNYKHSPWISTSLPMEFLEILKPLRLHWLRGSEGNPIFQSEFQLQSGRVLNESSKGFSWGEMLLVICISWRRCLEGPP